MLSAIIAVSLAPVVAMAGGLSSFRQTPASGITITKTWLNQHQQPLEMGVCASFVNTKSVTATRVEFLFSLIGKDGKIVYSTVHEAKGEFSPGALIEGERQTTCDTAYGVSYGRGKVSREGVEGSFVASVSQVAFADGSWWHAGPDILGAVFTQDDAPVHLAKAFSWEPGGSTQECAVFDARGTNRVRKIHLMFSHIAEDGHDVVDDPFDVYPDFGSGTVCRGWNGSLTPTVGSGPESMQPEILVFGKSARLVAWIGQIDFADGASWHAPEPSVSALAAAALPNNVDYANAVWWPSQLEVPEGFSQQPASGVQISKAYTGVFADAFECVDFVNQSRKQVTHVRFIFSHLAADHSTIGDEEKLDVHGMYDPEVSRVENCRMFEGNIVLPTLWNGGGNGATVLFQGKASTISVRIDRVDYADGSSWASPK